MATVDTIINNIISTEGGYVDNPADKGGPTAFGISEKANPQAWVNGPPTAKEARQIYMQKYVIGPGFDKIQDKQLQAQLVDFGVNSGPAIAIKRLQEILKVPGTGVLGTETLTALATIHPEEVNNLLVAARVKMICRIVQKTPSQLQFLEGWIDRALQFLE